MFGEEGGGFSVSDEALTILKGIEGRIAVVAVAGLYRTGKSFLLNRVVLDLAAAFTVGPSTRACTKGIWMWSEPVDTTDPVTNAPLKVLVIDTEGIGAPTADATHDTRIFALGLLLSSYFIYNSVGCIDEQALSNMSLVTNLSNELRAHAASASSSSASSSTDDKDSNSVVSASSSRSRSSSGSESETDDEGEDEGEEGEGEEEEETGRKERKTENNKTSFPGFLWVIRDFALQICDENGDVVSSRDYLEDALKPSAGRASEGKNRIRKCLRDYFQDRDCFTLVRPCTNETQLQNLDTTPNKLLRAEFLAQAQKLREKIFAEAARRPMVVNGCAITAAMLGMLCQSYVAAINAGKVPDIKDAWTYVCDAQKANLEQKAILRFNEHVNQTCSAPLSSSPSSSPSPPLNPAIVLRDCLKARSNALLALEKEFRALGISKNAEAHEAFLNIVVTACKRYEQMYSDAMQRYVSSSFLKVANAHAGASEGDIDLLQRVFTAAKTEVIASCSSLSSDSDPMAIEPTGTGTGTVTGTGTSESFSEFNVHVVDNTDDVEADGNNVLLLLLTQRDRAGQARAWTLALDFYRSRVARVAQEQADAVLWNVLRGRYGSVETHLNTLKADAERAKEVEQQLLADAATLRAKHQEEIAAKLMAQKELVIYFDAELTEKNEALAALTAKFEKAGEELLRLSTEHASRTGGLEQDTERERLRAETAEKEVAHLREEVDELTQEAGVAAEQARSISELSLERDRLRQDLSESKRALQEQKRTLASVELAFKKESKEVQAKVLQSLQAMKDTRKAEQLQMKAAKDAALARCATLETSVAQLDGELKRVLAQQAETLAAQEQQLQGVRTQLEESEQRSKTLVQDLSTKLQESEKSRKEKEKVSETVLTRVREERARVEQEYVVRLKEMETRAVNAESQVNEHRRQLDAANERWARKRARTEDSSEKSLQLVKVEAELTWLRQQKSDADAQLVNLRRENHDLEQTIRGLERGIDTQMTRAKLEYESKIAALEHRITTITES